MRKLIAIVLCMAMLFCVPVVNAQTASDALVDYDHLQVVKSLGILDAFSEYEIDNATVTRGEFASVITRLVGMEVSEETVGFQDVTEAHPYYNQIVLAHKMGVMVGDENGNFLPEAPVTYAQAVKCMVYVLGYTVYADRYGGYPTGYLIQANYLHLLSNLEVEANVPISRASLAQLVYNSLDVVMLEIMAFGDSVTYSKEERATILNQYLKVRKFEGVLNSVDGRSILSRVSDTEEGYLKIGSTQLTYNDVGISDYLGYRLEAYATISDEAVEHLIYAFPTGDNQEKLIAIDDLELGEPGFSLQRFYYTERNDTVKYVDLTSSHRFLYNGVYDFDFDLDDLTFSTGYVKLVDHDSDKIYDVCQVWDYKNYVFASASDKVVTCLYSKTLRLMDDATYRVRGSDGVWGGWEQFKNLSAWDILSVAVSKDHSLVTVYANRNGISGTVDAVLNENGKMIAQIGGQEYTVSPQYQNQPANTGYVPIKPGLTSEFYFDVMGEIAAVYQISATEDAYGYLLGAMPKRNLQEGYQVKIFTIKGKEEVYSTGKKVIFTSATYDSVSMPVENVFDAFEDGSGNIVPQLVRYSVDENGNLKKIQQYTDALADGYNLDKFSKDFEMGTVTSGNTQKFRFLDVAMTFGTDATYSTQFHINESTLIFYAPKVNGVIDEENMRMESYEMFEQGYYDNMTVFDCDDTYTAKVLVYTPDISTQLGEEYLIDNYLIAVTKVFHGLDEKEEIQPQILGFHQGSEKAFIYTSLDGSVPEVGSIIVCKKNPDGELEIRSDYVIYSPSAQSLTLGNRREIKGSGQVPVLWTQVGRLCRKNGSAISIHTGNTRPAVGYLNSSIVYLMKKNHQVELADESILVTSTGNPADIADGSLIVFNNRYHYSREIFVIEE